LFPSVLSIADRGNYQFVQILLRNSATLLL